MNSGNAIRMAIYVTSLASACMACSAQAPPADDAGDVRDAATARMPEAQTDSSPATAAATPTPAPTPRESDPPATATVSAEPPKTTDAEVDPAPEPTRPRIEQAAAESTALPTAAAVEPEDAAPVQLTINALSRGKGVPAETRDAFAQIRTLLEQQQANASVAEVQVQRIGLEGESRLCVEFRSRSDAQATLARIRTLSTGVDLLEVVETHCPSRKEYKP